MYYIQRKDETTEEVETVEQRPNQKIAQTLCKQLNRTDNEGHHYVSQQPCPNWRTQPGE